MQIDLMATPQNTRLPHFISPFRHPEAVAVDFFMTDLSRWTQVYVFPPTKLLQKVLISLRPFKGHGVIIAPWAPKQPWFGELLALSLGRKPLLHPPQQVVQGRQVLLQSTSSCPFLAWNF